MATYSYYKNVLIFTLGGILLTACTENISDETSIKTPQISQEKKVESSNKKEESENRKSKIASTDKNVEKEKQVIFIPPVVYEPDPLPEPYPRDPDPYPFPEPPAPPVEPRQKVDQEEQIHQFVDEPAEFPGGATKLKEYLAKNIVYPQTALELGIEGKVYLRFNVMKDGSINSVQVIRGIKDCPECDKEALRVVKAMPKWNPGKNMGNAVNSQMTIPVIFKLF